MRATLNKYPLVVRNKTMKTIKKSSKLDNVCYDIRGEVAREAKRLEEEGHRILKLNIGTANDQ